MASIIQLNKMKSFIDRVLEHVPEEKKTEVRAAYSSAQDEIDGAVTRVNTTASQQQDFWEKQGRNADGTPKQAVVENPVVAAVDTVALSRGFDEKLSSTRDQLAAQGMYLATVIPTIIGQHNAEFGELIDGEKLVADAIAAGKDLKSYYAELVAPKRAEKASATTAALIAKAREEGRSQGFREAGGSNPMPYPTGHSPAPMTLSGLQPRKEGDGRPDTTLDAAVETAMGVIRQQHATT